MQQLYAPSPCRGYQAVRLVHVLLLLATCSCSSGLSAVSDSWRATAIDGCALTRCTKREGVSELPSCRTETLTPKACEDYFNPSKER